MQQPMGEDIPYPYASSSPANIVQVKIRNLLPETQSVRMIGIVDGCCNKPCALNELSGYCS